MQEPKSPQRSQPLREKRRFFLSKPGTDRPTEAGEGRKIVFGFSYIELVGRDANTQVWFPPGLEERVAERLFEGDPLVLDEFQVEWAAVRQFELLREGTNFNILPMDLAEPKLCFRFHGAMRAGAFRVTVITMGRYEKGAPRDELEILDAKLQKILADFVSMIFLEEKSAEASASFAQLAEKGAWNIALALPHVATKLGAAMLFKPARAVAAEKRFLQLLELLPPQKICHDVAVGLQLPELGAKKEWTYLAPAGQKYYRLQSLMSDLFRSFDGLSLHELDGRAGPAHDKVMASVRHMRGFGDHMSGARRADQLASARLARQAFELSLTAA